MAAKNPDTDANAHETDPHQCPFCGEYVASPGKGFMLHVEENEDCSADFDTWRDRIAGDVPAGWSG